MTKYNTDYKGLTDMELVNKMNALADKQLVIATVFDRDIPDDPDSKCSVEIQAVVRFKTEEDWKETDERYGFEVERTLAFVNENLEIGIPFGQIRGAWETRNGFAIEGCRDSYMITVM